MRTRLVIMILLALTLGACNLPSANQTVAPTSTPKPPEPAATDNQMATIPPVETATQTLPPPTETATEPAPNIPVIGWVPFDYRMFNFDEGWGQDWNGYLLHTVDGGRTWVDATPPEIAGTGSRFSLGYRSAQALWAMPFSSDVDNGTILRTLDGGATWQSFTTPFGWAALAPVDEQRLYALADYGGGLGSQAVALWTTPDGGATWSLLADARPDNDTVDTLPFSGNKSGLGAAHVPNLFVTGYVPMDNYTYVYSSTDAGVTWTRLELYLPIELGNLQAEFLPPQFFGDFTGVMYARINSPDASFMGIYLTADGGLSWPYYGAAPVPGVIASPDIEHFFLYDGEIFYSGVMVDDEYIQWTGLTPNLPSGNYPTTMQFLDALNGWLVLDLSGAYQIYRTSDGGQTWTLLAEAGG